MTPDQATFEALSEKYRLLADRTRHTAHPTHQRCLACKYRTLEMKYYVRYMLLEPKTETQPS